MSCVVKIKEKICCAVLTEKCIINGAEYYVKFWDSIDPCFIRVLTADMMEFDPQLNSYVILTKCPFCGSTRPATFNIEIVHDSPEPICVQKPECRLIRFMPNKGKE